MPIMIQREKWILYRHTSDFELVKAVALDVKSNCKTIVTDVERNRMQARLTALNLYKARNTKKNPLDAINHRINTLEYWMFGYEQKVAGEKRFMFSPLGNLFLKYINDSEKLEKIFLTMLFALQFPHPGNNTSRIFQLFPFRLILKLLTDGRLDNKLYNFEVEYCVVFVTDIDDDTYEILVNQILSMRKKRPEEIASLLQDDSHVYVNTVYEWEYYTQRLLSMAGILLRYEGELITTLYHPTRNEKTKKTPRKATSGYVMLNPRLLAYTRKMLDIYAYTEAPLSLSDSETLTIDIIKEIYSFYPEILLNEIG